MGHKNPRIANAIYATTTERQTVPLLDVDGTVKPLDLDKIPDHAEMVVVQAQVAPIRFTTDGENPVATGAGAYGEILYVGERYVLSPADARAAKFTRDGATNAKLHYKIQTH